MSKRKTKTKIPKPNKQASESPTQKKVPSKEPGEKKKLLVNTKQELLVEMLSKTSGTNIDTIVKATGWQPHTSRAMISGLRKAGHKVETAEGTDGKTVYRIVGAKKSSGKTGR